MYRQAPGTVSRPTGTREVSTELTLFRKAVGFCQPLKFFFFSAVLIRADGPPELLFFFLLLHPSSLLSSLPLSIKQSFGCLLP